MHTWVLPVISVVEYSVSKNTVKQTFSIHIHQIEQPNQSSYSSINHFMKWEFKGHRENKV